MTTTQAHIELVHELLSNTQYGLNFNPFKNSKKKPIDNGGFNFTPFNKVKNPFNNAGSKGNEELLRIKRPGIKGTFKNIEERRRVNDQRKVEKQFLSLSEKTGVTIQNPEVLAKRTDATIDEVNASRLRDDAYNLTKDFQKKLERASRELRTIYKNVMAAYTQMDSSMRDCDSADTQALNKTHAEFCSKLKEATVEIGVKMARMEKAKSDTMNRPQIEALYDALTPEDSLSIGKFGEGRASRAKVMPIMPK